MSDRTVSPAGLTVFAHNILQTAEEYLSWVTEALFKIETQHPPKVVLEKKKLKFYSFDSSLRSSNDVQDRVGSLWVKPDD